MASRRLKGGLKPSKGEAGFERLEEDLKRASRRRKGASRGLEGGFKEA